jgi:hypothetical protein
VTLIVPSAAGGGTDTIARLIGDQLSWLLPAEQRSRPPSCILLAIRDAMDAPGRQEASMTRNIKTLAALALATAILAAGPANAGFGNGYGQGFGNGYGQGFGNGGSLQGPSANGTGPQGFGNGGSLQGPGPQGFGQGTHTGPAADQNPQAGYRTFQVIGIELPR